MTTTAMPASAIASPTPPARAHRYVGMITGQLVMGLLGDLIGGGRALRTSVAVTVFGALGSALSNSYVGVAFRIDLFYCLAFFQFVLGAGAGGIYPVAATLAAASGVIKQKSEIGVTPHGSYGAGRSLLSNGSGGSGSGEGVADGKGDHGGGSLRPGNGGSVDPLTHRRSPSAVAFVFSMQGLGLVLTPAVAWLILMSGGVTDVIGLTWIDEGLYWRLVLGFGGVPGLVLVWLRVMPIPSFKKKVGWVGRS